MFYSLNGQFCRLEKGRICFIFWPLLYFTDLEHAKKYSDKNLTPRYILNIFLKFRKFDFRLNILIKYILVKLKEKELPQGFQMINTILQDHFELLVGIS